MNGKCYYCGKELTERTIKRHMKSCSVMKARIEEKLQEIKKIRKQYLISIKPKHGKSEFCLYISIDGSLGLIHIDRLIRDVWVESHGISHLSGFKISRKFYEDAEMNIKLSDILDVGKKFEYEYDFEKTTKLTLEVVDIIEVPIVFSQIEIIARNHEVKNACESCGEEARHFNAEKEVWLCKKCIGEKDENITEVLYCNSPRAGIGGYAGKMDAEEAYLPGNSDKYKSLGSKAIKRKCDDEILTSGEANNMENIVEDLSDEAEDFTGDIFSKGIYSFDINELVKKLNKNKIYDIGRNLKIKNVGSLKKEQLADKFLDGYEGAIEELLNLFDEKRFNTIKRIADNSGIKLISDEEFESQMNYFISMGMLFGAKDNNGQDVLVMPEVLQNIIKDRNNSEYKKLIKINTKIINLFRGMNKAYGIIKTSDIEALFKRYGIEKSEKTNIEAIIKEAQYYYDEYEEEEGFIINNEVPMWRRLLEDIQEDTDYHKVSKEELLSMSEADWIYTSKIGKDFIKEVGGVLNADKDMLEEIIESLVSEIQKRDFDEIVNDILGTKNSTNEQVKEFVYISVGKLLRNIRLWKYKGATINEQVKNKIKAEKQETVGRNEPCICGSGKKYKHCCGKK